MSLKSNRLTAGLSKNTFLLALTSFFADISTEMLYPVLPLFLTQVLVAPASIVGLVEGVAQGTQNVIQGFSGWLADRTQKKKPLALFGYGLAALSKPFIGTSAAWPQVLVGRFADRSGTGTRSAPRDALIAQSADEEHRGRAFGLEGFGDNLGAVVGPLITVGLLYLLQVNLRSIFYLAFIPGFLAFVMISLVKEKKPAAAQTPTRLNLRSLPRSYWKFLIPVALFSLANASTAFLILRLKDLGVATATTIFVYAFFNLVAALVSYPSGVVIDKLGRKITFLAALTIFAGVFLGFAVSSNVLAIAGLFALYGAYQGIFRAVGKTLAIDLATPQLKASGVGIFSSVFGLGSFAASLIGGQLWVAVSPAATFYYGFALALAGLFTAFFFIPATNHKQTT